MQRSRVGSRRVRKHDIPQTPLQRLLHTELAHSPHVDALQAKFVQLDPFELSSRIDRQLDDLFALANTTPLAPIVSTPRLNRAEFTTSARRNTAHMISLKRMAALTLGHT